MQEQHVTVWLADGRKMEVEQRFLPVIEDARPCKLAPLSGGLAGYGEIVTVTMNNGDTYEMVLTPHEYEHHMAIRSDG